MVIVNDFLSRTDLSLWNRQIALQPAPDSAIDGKGITVTSEARTDRTAPMFCAEERRQ